MKLKTTITGLFLLMALTFAMPFDTLAQHGHHGGPPPWAPAHGYRAKTSYVFFPDYNFYYDVHRELYFYMQGGNWAFGFNLPARLARIDLRSAPLVELAIVTDRPYIYNHNHIKYYKNHHGARHQDYYGNDHKNAESRHRHMEGNRDERGHGGHRK